MDTHAIVLQILQYIIEGGIAVLVPIAINYLLTKTSKEKLIKYANLAETVVKAVQQTFPETDLTGKKEAAVQRLSDMTKGVLTQEDIDHLIEEAVFNMKNEVTKTVQPEMPQVQEEVQQ